MDKEINNNESGESENEGGARSSSGLSSDEKDEEGKEVVEEIDSDDARGDEENGDDTSVTHVTGGNENIEIPPESLRKFLNHFFMARWLIFCRILAFIIIKKKRDVDDELEDQGSPSTIMYKKRAVKLKDKRSLPAVLNDKVKCQVDGTSETNNLPMTQPTRSLLAITRHMAAGILVVGTDWLASIKRRLPYFKRISVDKTEFVDEYLMTAVQNKDSLEKSRWCVGGCLRYCSEYMHRLVNDTSD